MTAPADDRFSRRPLAETHPHLKDFFQFLPELNKESDRGRALISCSYIDDLLCQTLRAFFIEGKQADQLIEGFNAPLGNLSTRIAASYALGLISEREFKECEVLRRVRNRFAHEIHTSFDDQSVRDMCSNLTFSAKSYEDVLVDARFAFTSAAVALISNLINRPVYVSSKRRQSEDWPA